MKKVVMPNYNECITNLACSIMKYFELDIKHNSIVLVDEILENKRPKNVVVILYDGMGLNIMNRVLGEKSFLVENTIKGISSVSPSTTTASTTSMLSGLNPVEHGWLGWDLYIKPVDKIVTMFLNTIKDTDDVVADYNVAKRYYPYKDITTKINERGKDYSQILFPFGDNSYTDIDDMNNKIFEECQKDGKKYIYAYYVNPDSTMHEYGTNSEKSIQVIKMINEKTKELCSRLKDTIVIITADHGHINCDGILLTDYPDFFDTLDGDIWIEGRFCSFKVKDNRNKEFINLFNKYFSKDFILKTKLEVINEKIFGTGEENPLFVDSLGDFFALAVTNKYFRYNENSINLKSVHAGFTDDEMIIPLIIISK